MSYDDFDVDRARELREKAKDGFAKECRKTLLATIAVSVPIMALIAFAAVNWAQPANAEARMFYALVGLLGLLLNMLLWAVLGLDVRMLFLLKEMKLLRLDTAVAGDQASARATGGAESLSVWKMAAIKPWVLPAITLGALLVYAGCATLTHRFVHYYNDSFGGEEVVEVHVAQDGSLRVVSRVNITRCAANPATVPLRIPQPGATLQSVSVDGRPIPFEAVPGQPDTYAVMPGLPENALTKATLEVVWAPPAEQIKTQGEGRQFTLRIRSMVPFTYYAANAVIDPGAPYEFSGPTAKVRSYNMFWSRRPTSDYYEGEMGTCGLEILPMRQ